MDIDNPEGMHPSTKIVIFTILLMYNLVLTRYSPENLVSWFQVHFIKFHTCILKDLIAAHEIKIKTRFTHALERKKVNSMILSNGAYPSPTVQRPIQI